MTAPTYSDAKHRRIVRLTDGRTGRLLFLHGSRSRTPSRGLKARVELPGGAIISVDPASLTVIDELGRELAR